MLLKPHWSLIGSVQDCSIVVCAWKRSILDYMDLDHTDTESLQDIEVHLLAHFQHHSNMQCLANNLSTNTFQSPHPAHCNANCQIHSTRFHQTKTRFQNHPDNLLSMCFSLLALLENNWWCCHELKLDLLLDSEILIGRVYSHFPTMFWNFWTCSTFWCVWICDDMILSICNLTEKRSERRQILPSASQRSKF